MTGNAEPTQDAEEPIIDQDERVHLKENLRAMERERKRIATLVLYEDLEQKWSDNPARISKAKKGDTPVVVQLIRRAAMIRDLQKQVTEANDNAAYDAVASLQGTVDKAMANLEKMLVSVKNYDLRHAKEINAAIKHIELLTCRQMQFDRIMTQREEINRQRVRSKIDLKKLPLLGKTGD